MANTRSPEVTLIETLAAYLQTSLSANAQLSASKVVTEWPEPTTRMQLAPNAVSVAVIRSGQGTKPRDNLGSPKFVQLYPGTYPACTIRYDYGIVEMPIVIGLWAQSRALRDDVDYVIEQLMNQPYWSTVSPVVSTTLATAITTTGMQKIYPASMADIWPGTKLQIDTGANQEVVQVTEIQPTFFWASPRGTHAASVAMVEVAGRYTVAESGLSLRAPNYFNAVCRYDVFDSMPVTDGSESSQLQEWMSMRTGVGKVRSYIEVPGVQQGRFFIQEQAANAADVSQFTLTNPPPFVKREF